MKVLILTKPFYPNIGGIEIYLENLAKEMIKRKISVDIVCSNEGQKIKNQEIYKGMKIYRYNMPLLNKENIWKWPVKHAEEAFRIINKELRFRKYDLIVCAFSIFLEKAIEKFGARKIIYIAPSVYAKFGKSIRQTKIQKKVYSLMKEIEINQIQKVRAVSLSVLVKRELKNLNTKINVTVVKPGIDKKFFKIKRKRQNRALYVGRLTEEKGLKALIRISSWIKKGKIAIVGGGNNVNELKKYTKLNGDGDIIDFLGWSSKPEIEMAKSKILVLPSNYEAFGLVLIEGMASGLPCIAFKPDGKKYITASDEIIEDKITGFLVENEKEMADKINLLLHNDNLREKMGNLARKKALKYSWKSHVKNILKLANS